MWLGPSLQFLGLPAALVVSMVAVRRRSGRGWGLAHFALLLAILETAALAAFIGYLMF